MKNILMSKKRFHARHNDMCTYSLHKEEDSCPSLLDPSKAGACNRHFFDFFHALFVNVYFGVCLLNEAKMSSSVLSMGVFLMLRVSLFLA
jgi:hypothetical protein